MKRNSKRSGCTFRGFVLVLAFLLWPPMSYAESLHDVTGNLVDQNGKAFSPTSLKGKKVIGTVVYTTCPTICLFTIQNIKKIEASLKNSTEYTFLLVTADPKVDTPEIMRAYLQKHKVDKANWIFAGGKPRDVAKLLSTMDMGFAKKTGANHIMHSIKIAYIDPEGVVSYRIQGVEPPIEELLRYLLR